MVERHKAKFAVCEEAVRFIMKVELDFPQTEGLVVPLMVFKVRLALAKKNILEENRYIYQVLKEYISKGIEAGEFRPIEDVSGLVRHILRTYRGDLPLVPETRELRFNKTRACGCGVHFEIRLI
jgi:hypothetical protein